jgi:hypothetical protein
MEINSKDLLYFESPKNVESISVSSLLSLFKIGNRFIE